MTVRRAKEGDGEAVLDLIRQLEPHPVETSEFYPMYQVNLQDPAVDYLVAVDDRKIVAFGSLHTQRLLHHTGLVAEIQELVVDESVRSQGVGGQIFTALKDAAAARHCVLLEVSCNRARERSHLFYEKQGMARSHFKFTLPMQ